MTADELARHRALSKHVAATFGEIVSLLMRQPSSRGRTLADLEWLVMPALMANQISVAEAQSVSHGYTMPVAVILWARVSPEVDRRLAGQLDRSFELAPNEWTSGDIIWLIEATGEPRALQAALGRLLQTWQGKVVKYRSAGPDGKSVLAVVGAQEPAVGMVA